MPEGINLDSTKFKQRPKTGLLDQITYEDNFEKSHEDEVVYNDLSQPFDSHTKRII
jgi:hypothetical protein